MRKHRGRKSTEWGTAYQQANGRWQVWISEDRPERTATKYRAYEHRLVWEKHCGPIPAGYIVHHINGDMSDNRLENLELMSHAEHNSRHKHGYHYTYIYSPGAPVSKQCRGCGEVLPIGCFEHNGYSKAGTPTVKPRCHPCQKAYEAQN